MCNAGSPEYSLLRTAVILRHDGTQDVNLFCEDADAQSLVDFASMPQVASQIKLGGGFLILGVAASTSGGTDKEP